MARATASGFSENLWPVWPVERENGVMDPLPKIRARRINAQRRNEEFRATGKTEQAAWWAHTAVELLELENEIRSAETLRQREAAAESRGRRAGLEAARIAVATERSAWTSTLKRSHSPEIVQRVLGGCDAAEACERAVAALASAPSKEQDEQPEALATQPVSGNEAEGIPTATPPAAFSRAALLERARAWWAKDRRSIREMESLEENQVGYLLGILADFALALLAERQAERRACSVCAGTGVPVSGLPCICGGSGREADEMVGLRKELFRLQSARPAEGDAETHRCNGVQTYSVRRPPLACVKFRGHSGDCLFTDAALRAAPAAPQEPSLRVRHPSAQNDPKPPTAEPARADVFAEVAEKLAFQPWIHVDAALRARFGPALDALRMIASHRCWAAHEAYPKWHCGECAACVAKEEMDRLSARAEETKER